MSWQPAARFVSFHRSYVCMYCAHSQLAALSVARCYPKNLVLNYQRSLCCCTFSSSTQHSTFATFAIYLERCINFGFFLQCTADYMNDFNDSFLLLFPINEMFNLDESVNLAKAKGNAFKFFRFTTSNCIRVWTLAVENESSREK